MSVSSLRAVNISTGTGRCGLDPAADLQPVESGQHDIEDDQVRGGGRRGRDRGRPVDRGVHRKASARSRVATAARMVGSSSTTRIRFTPSTVGPGCGAFGQRL